MKAVIETGSKQYIVEKGDKIEIELVPEAKTLTFDPLMVFDEKSAQVGKPTVDKIKVKAKVLDPAKQDKKVTSIRYKAKKRVNKKRGHRQKHTVIEITGIA